MCFDHFGYSLFFLKTVYRFLGSFQNEISVCSCVFNAEVRENTCSCYVCVAISNATNSLVCRAQDKIPWGILDFQSCTTFFI